MLKANKVESFEADGFKIKLSPLAFIPEMTNPVDGPSSVEDEDDLLYYSAPQRPA